MYFEFQVAACQFHRCHDVLQKLHKRQVFLTEAVADYIQKLEVRVLEHYKTQTQCVDAQQKSLARTIKELALHSTQLSEMTNSDVISNRDGRRQRCQEVRFSPSKTIDVRELSEA